MLSYLETSPLLNNRILNAEQPFKVMSTLTIQNVSHGKINVRVFCSSNIFLCQEILSSELSFVHTENIYYWSSYVWRASVTLTDFQFKFLPIDKYTVLVLALREKSEAKRKSITFSFNFIFIVEQTLSETRPGTHYCGTKFPRNPLFLFVFVGDIAPDF